MGGKSKTKPARVVNTARMTQERMKLAPPSENKAKQGLEQGDAEPTFTLRARDSLAADTVRLWARTAEVRGAPAAKVKAAMAKAAEMEAWGKKHGTKEPD
jgi:hypothetical protein